MMNKRPTTTADQPAGHAQGYNVAATVKVHCGTQVWAYDGRIGSVSALVIDMQTAEITHLVVTNADAAGSGRLVALSCVSNGDGERIVLEVDRAEVLRFDHFTVPYKLPYTPLDYADSSDSVSVWLIPPGGFTFALHDAVPDGALALRAPVAVRTSEGEQLGIVVSWDLERSTGRIQSIVVREGHIFNRSKVSVAGSLIDQIDDEGVLLSAPRRGGRRLIDPHTYIRDVEK